MRITLDDVKMTASMARLHLSSEESLRIQKELDQVLAYAVQLEEVDVTNVEPTTHAIPMQCPLRADEVGAHLSLEESLHNAPKREAAFFAVPVILSKEEG